MRPTSVRTINVELYKKRGKEMEKADASGTTERYFYLIGAITTMFEQAEAWLIGSISPLSRDTDLFSIVISKINSRATRAEILEEFLARRKPKRPTKKSTAIMAAFDAYKRLGAQRDQVAHAMLMNWQLGDGKGRLVLQPGWHIEKKNVGGLPTYHYDIPAMEKLAKELDQLNTDVRKIQESIARDNQRRLAAHHKRVLARAGR